MNPYAELWAELWCQTPVVLTKPGGRTAFGPTPGETVEVQADVDTTVRTVLNQRAEEITVAATVAWHPDGPAPAAGDTITLPDEFGLPGPREIVTVTLKRDGNGLTPDHREVTLK